MDLSQNIPKRLAARIRAAQSKVTEAMRAIVADECRIGQDSQRISEYEADPAAFARRHYRNCAFDSYPVQTNVSRCRESLSHRTARMQRSLDELAAAEANLARIEQDVLREAAQLKSNTSGRVPWPDPLISLEEFRKIESAASNLLQRELEIQRAKDAIEAVEEEAELARQHQIEDDESLRDWRARFSQMSPREQIEELAAAAQLREALASGEITPLQVIEHLRSKHDAP